MLKCYVDVKTGKIIPELNVSVNDYNYINNCTKEAVYEEIVKEDKAIALVSYNGKTYKAEMHINQFFDGKDFYINLNN